MTALSALQSIIAQGESETLEFKRSTAELQRAGQTLCGFLNGDGGQVLLGVGPKGQLVGQQVADITLRDMDVGDIVDRRNRASTRRRRYLKRCDQSQASDKPLLVAPSIAWSLVA